jgi:hypothetical protein
MVTFPSYWAATGFDMEIEIRKICVRIRAIKIFRDLLCSIVSAFSLVFQKKGLPLAKRTSSG